MILFEQELFNTTCDIVLHAIVTHRAVVFQWESWGGVYDGRERTGVSLSYCP